MINENQRIIIKLSAKNPPLLNQHSTNPKQVIN